MKAPSLNANNAPKSSLQTQRSTLTLALTALLLAAGCNQEDEESASAPLDQAVNQEPADGEPAADDDKAANSAAQASPLDTLARGPLAVGFRTFHEAYPDGTSLEIKAWYPAVGDGADPSAIDYEVSLKIADWQEEEPTLIHGHAERDAALTAETASYPVVVFSHGFSMNPEWYSALTEHFASHGFVVLAPEHQEADWFQTVVPASFRRPVEIHRTLDFAETLAGTGGEFEDRLDLDRVAVVGHSYGGYTALAAAGARFDADAVREACSGLEETDPKQFLCMPFLGAGAELDELAEQSPAAYDPRVKAIVPIAGDAYLFGAGGLQHVNVPTLALGGTGDTAAPWAWGTQLTYDSISSERALLLGFEDGEHMLPMNTCDDLPWTSNLPPEMTTMLCADPAWERGEALALVAHFSTAFLLDTLTNSDAARSALSQASVADFEGIVYARTE